MSQIFTPTFNIITGFDGAPTEVFGIWTDKGNNFFEVEAYFKGVSMPVLATLCSFSSELPLTPDPSGEAVGGIASIAFYNGGGTLSANSSAPVMPFGINAVNNRVTVSIPALALATASCDIYIRYTFSMENH